NHLTPTTFITLVGMPLDPVRDFGLDGLSQHPLSAIPQNRRQDITALGQWQHLRVRRRILHGGVLLCLVGSWVEIRTNHTQSTPPFFIWPSTTFGYTSAGAVPSPRLRSPRTGEKLLLLLLRFQHRALPNHLHNGSH